jgi:rhodanese-related sulfurtransferase
MKKIVSLLAAFVTAVTVMFGVTACAPENIDMRTVTAVIDVRTPAEFAEGHLDGAVNIDWQGATFADEIAKFDPAGTYVIYCRSGNRSAQAISAMTEMGFTNLTNAGSVEEAAGLTGLAIVP